MPATNPQVGETWELYDQQTGRASQAVLVTIAPPGPGAVAPTLRLVNRLGRVLTLPQNSLLLTWTFVHGAVTHPCWYRDRPGGCDRQASLQVNDPAGWVWVCDRHLPAGQQALLPFDLPQDRDHLTALENQCPKCNTSLTTPGSGSEVDPETETVVMRCGRCGSQWVHLLGRGEEEDGVQLSENITMASEVLHGRATNIRAIVGFTAWSAIRRIIQPASHVAGTPVQQGSNVGSNNVIIIGDRPVTGPGVAQPRRPNPLAPAVGSIWQEVHGGQLIEVVDIRDTPGEGDVVAFSVGSGPEDHITLPVREFLARFTLNGRPRLRPGDPHPMAPPSEKRAAGPRAGDSWWHRRTGRPAFILSVGVDDEGRHVVRYRDSGPALPIEMKEFLATFTLDPPDPGCKEGEEWLDEQGVLITIEEVRIPRREIIGMVKGQRVTVPLALFMARYHKLVRRSAYDLIVGDHDDDDDP